MTKRAIPWMLSLAVCCLSTTPAEASGEGMRCGSELVTEGDSMYEVRSVCGEPVATLQRIEYRSVTVYAAGSCFVHKGRTMCGRYEQQLVPVMVEEWTYDFGSTSFIRFVTFEQGKLRKVVLGDYGKK